MKKFTLMGAVAAFAVAFGAIAFADEASTSTTPYTLNPASGTVVTELQGITIDFTAAKVAFPDNSRMPVAVLENLTTGAEYLCYEPERNTFAQTDGSFYTFTFVDEDDEAVANINAPGEYVLTIRSMYSEVEGGDNVYYDPIVAKYTVEYPVAYTLTPAPGTAVTDLQGIELNFTEEWAGFYENNRMPVATLENLTTGALYTCEEPARNPRAETMGAAYVFVFVDEDGDLAESISQPGEYVLSVKGLVYGDEADPTDLPNITANYTIAYPVNYELTPAAGETVENLQGITVDFTDNRVAFYENSNMPVAVLENNTTGKVYNCELPTRDTFAATQGTFWTFMFNDEDGDYVKEITEPGYYTLTIRAMYYGSDEDPVDLPVITANYLIAYPAAYVLNPAAGNVENLQDITINFTDNKVAFYENSNMPVVVLENTTTGAVYNCFEPDRDTHAETDGAFYTFRFLDEDDEYLEFINQPGDYVLTIRGMYYTVVEDPEAEVEEEMIDLPVITVKYTIEYPAPYVLTPDNGANVENLQDITIDFTANKVAFYENSNMPVVVLENTTTGAVYNCYEPDRNMKAETEGAFYTFRFLDEDDDYLEVISEPGNYTLTIRGMYYTVVSDIESEEDPETVDLPVITANYTIEYPVAYTLTPDNGAQVESFQSITIDFTDTKVAFYENSNMPVVVLENVTSGKVYSCFEPDRNMKAETDGAFYTFNFMDEDDDYVALINEPGSYLLTIRGMYYTVATEGEEEVTVDLPVITAAYTIEYPVEYVLNPADGAELEAITSISIEFPNNNNIAYYEGSRMPIATLTNGLEGDDEVAYYCYEPDRDVRAESEGIVYTFVFLDENDEMVTVKADGTWHLTINGFYVEGETEEDDNVDLPVIYATYTVSNADAGVDSVFVNDSDVVNAYTINGIQVVRNGNADSVKNLPAGLYIINGKKVIIK